MPKKILFMLVVLSLNSCNFFSNGPYKNKLLDNLGDSKNISFSHNFVYTCSATCNKEHFNLHMFYNSEINDFEAKDFTYFEYNKTENTDENISIAQTFLNKYFFLYKEKLARLFPATDPLLSFGNRILKTSEIDIYKYENNYDRENKTYELYHYSSAGNYLCLKSFSYFKNNEKSYDYYLSFSR